MDNEPYRDLSHLELIATVSDWLRAQGNRVTNEHRLPNGKIADVIYTTPGGAIHIVECKTFLTSTLIERAYIKYYGYCHALWVASNDAQRWWSYPFVDNLSLDHGRRPAGLIEVSHGHVSIVIEPCAHSLDPVTVARIKHGLPTP